jgi:hypothetical protein
VIPGIVAPEINKPQRTQSAQRSVNIPPRPPRSPRFERVAAHQTAQHSYEINAWCRSGLAGTLEAWFLAFLDARIASQETSLAHGRHPIGVHLDQRAGKPERHRISLAGDTAAINQHGDVILATFLTGGSERRKDGFQVTQAGEIDLSILIVHDKPTFAAHDADAR